jgi:hypothetical protein
LIFFRYIASLPSLAVEQAAGGFISNGVYMALAFVAGLWGGVLLIAIPLLFGRK